MSSTSNISENRTTRTTPTVIIKEGDISKVSADVLVTSCPPNNFTKCSGFATSASLFQQAGDGLKNACEKLASASTLKVGDVLQTPGFNLSCKEVFHILLNTYNGSNENDIRTAIKFCLTTAERKRYKRIAFPAVGTGGMKYPAKLIAQLFEQIFTSFKGKYLKNIEIVLYPKSEAINVFTKVFRVTSLPVKIVDGQLIISHPQQQPEKKSKDFFLLKQGNILTSSCQALVNPTTSSFNLSGSRLSSKLLDVAGSNIAHECQFSPLHQSPCYRVTHGGNLKCEYIIHAASTKDICLLAGTLQSILTLAENTLKVKSLAIPAIATGGAGMKSADVAIAMETAFQNFKATNPQNLRHIEVVIFEDKMLPDFEAAFSNLSLSNC